MPTAPVASSRWRPATTLLIIAALPIIAIAVWVRCSAFEIRSGDAPRFGTTSLRPRAGPIESPAGSCPTPAAATPARAEPRRTGG